MTTDETIEFLNNCNKDDFINYAKELNIYKTTKQPNYLIIRDHVISLLNKHNLTQADIIPNPRMVYGDLQVKTFK